MQALLSFDQAPPIAAPVRFLVTAPLFLAGLGVLLVLRGPEVFVSRWTGAALAATHLVTVGFLLQVMLGALIQILPVVAGAHVARPLALAAVVHGGLSLGGVALATAFLIGEPLLYGLAAVLLGGSVAVFLGVAGRTLYAVPTTSPTIGGLKLAFFALAVVAGLGVMLAGGLGFGWALPLADLADLHGGWGLGAWAGILLAALAYVVVPMFQLTPGYPLQPSKLFPRVLVAAMLSWTVAVAGAMPVVSRLAEGVAAATGIAFAVYTLNLQRKRRRARSDATFRLWQLGLVSMVVALAMAVATALFPNLSDRPGWTPLFAVLVGVGGYMSLVVGMMYKIVPFLAWLHLQNLAPGKSAPPINRFLPEHQAQRQAAVHGLAVLLLAVAAFFPEAGALPAGLAVLAAASWLELNLLTVLARYRQYRKDLVGQ
ncbi:MAG TPA: hypothetical protein PKD04_03640 [Rhodocyclaceae bacterium]|nr:hypothetical protein [Betaproteobacteria bacterium]HMV00149.1 hypothetical protein [Rhodocyclaceae bacterium]HMV20148.1 hypothetical protein [Rhodocyclaceae bacterium]HMW76751.1 hypothetical protein [Rhodocyclaceae bacterium]HNE41656.1 hypothetical protein [Rhodocyclaceae bacterium]